MCLGDFVQYNEDNVNVHSPVLISFCLNELQIKADANVSEVLCILSLLSCGMFGGKGYINHCTTPLLGNSFLKDRQETTPVKQYLHSLL